MQARQRRLDELERLARSVRLAAAHTMKPEATRMLSRNTSAASKPAEAAAPGPSQAPSRNSSAAMSGRAPAEVPRRLSSLSRSRQGAAQS